MKTLEILGFAVCLAASQAFVAPTGPTRSFQRSPDAGVLADSPALALSPGEAWDAYNTALEANPLIVKSITASIILGSADFTGQIIEKIQDDETPSDDAAPGTDWARAARFAIFGLVLQAPWNHFYYNVLDGAIPPTPEPFTPTNFVKIFIDQFIQAPIFTVLIFVFLGALEGKSVANIQSQLKSDYKETILANCA